MEEGEREVLPDLVLPDPATRGCERLARTGEQENRTETGPNGPGIVVGHKQHWVQTANYEEMSSEPRKNTINAVNHNVHTLQ